MFSLPGADFHEDEKKHYYFCFISPGHPGWYNLSLQLWVTENCSALPDKADECAEKLQVIEGKRTATNDFMSIALGRNSWFYLPGQGMIKGPSGSSYPSFVAKAHQSKFTDSLGRKYIDYVMGWGSSLLGHGHPDIRKSVSKSVQNGSMLSLPHLLEMEVTQLLGERFKGAEAVLFGKNGSDVTTAAVRLSRIFTGKHHVLYCGYHGWQDDFAECIGFPNSGVPERSTPLMHPFRYGDLQSLIELLEKYSNQIAAIIIEPAGVIESIQGPIHDADPVFLTTISELARKSGALLIFDEIMTGFRYLKGSVHQYCGLNPDLVCLGKGLSAGLPLSALIGRGEILHKGMQHIYYHPTFKGDVCALAAAKAALLFYQKKDVPGHIWRFGAQLARSITELFSRFNIPASIVGPPFRMGVTFHVEDIKYQRLLRTLLHQELIKNGIFTFDTIMLPSYAHTGSDLKKTCMAFARSMEVIQKAMETGYFAKFLEIPEVASHQDPMCLTPKEQPD